MSGPSSTASASPDVVIVGGGIVGCSAAAYLAETGATVTLLEAAVIGAGASGRNSGVVQHPFDPALRDLHLDTLAAYRDLAADPDSGLPLASEPTGLLLVALAPDGPRALTRVLRRAWPELEPSYVDGEELHRLEPGLAPDVAACRVRIGYPVPPASATRAYATLAQRHGARILVGTAVAGLVRDREGGRVTGVRRADGTVMAAGAVLVAAGPWSSSLLDPTGAWRPIRPFWGVVAEVGLADPPRHVIEESGMDEALGGVTSVAASGVPPVGGGALAASSNPAPDAPPELGDGPDENGDRPEFSLVTALGRSSLGSTFLEAEPDAAAWVPRLVARGRRFVPALGTAAIGPVRACARPSSADERPLLGAVPGMPGAFLAAGHGPWGISTGPASARLVGALILGRSAAIAPELDAARFGSPDERPTAPR